MASNPPNKGLNRPWVLWEVIVPLGMPVVISLVVVFMSATGPSPSPISLEAAIDLAPWTLCFFAFTLLASSMRKIWPKSQQYPKITLWMLVMMFPVALYAGFLVSWHQDAAFKPTAVNYLISVLLTAAAVWRCHASSKI